MTGRSGWNDWITEDFFRIRVAPAAAEKLCLLPDDVQARLRLMLREIAELADLVPQTVSENWEVSGHHFLQLTVAGVTLHYSISEQNRTLSVEHVVFPRERYGQTG